MSLRATVALTISSFVVCGAASGQSGDETLSPEVLKQACVDAATRGQEDRDAGLLLEARRQLRECARDACPGPVRRSCVQWLDALEPRIPSLVVRVHDALQRDVRDAQASLDGVPIALDGRPIALNPGEHRLAVHAPNAAPIEHTVLVIESQAARLVSLELAKLPTAATVRAPSPVDSAPTTQRESGFTAPLGAWILGGGGVLSLLVFTGFAIAAADEYSALEDRCAPACTNADKQDFDSYRVTADVSLGIGLAALAGGAVWTVLAQHDEPEPRMTGTIVPSRHGAVGVLTTRF